MQTRIIKDNLLSIVKKKQSSWLRSTLPQAHPAARKILVARRKAAQHIQEDQRAQREPYGRESRIRISVNCVHDALVTDAQRFSRQHARLRV